MFKDVKKRPRRSNHGRDDGSYSIGKEFFEAKQNRERSDRTYLAIGRPSIMLSAVVARFRTVEVWFQSVDKTTNFLKSSDIRLKLSSHRRSCYLQPPSRSTCDVVFVN